MPERVGSKVLPIPTKSRFIHSERPEALGEQQEPPRIHAGEVSEPELVLSPSTLSFTLPTFHLLKSRIILVYYTVLDSNCSAGGAGGRSPLAGARGVLASFFFPCRRRRHRKST